MEVTAIATRETLLDTARSLLHGEPDMLANMANLCALILQVKPYHWVGFYRVVNDELVLGPFQGPIACTRIARGRGVCGTAWAENTTQLVPDVDAFPGHIACSPYSRSEIVVPVHNASGDVVAVLDIDSSELNDFSAEDARLFEALCALLTPTA